MATMQRQLLAQPASAPAAARTPTSATSASGAPPAARWRRYADMHPAQIMRAVQLGQLDMVFDDRFIWLCTGCETCTTRCPQGIDIATIIDELKIMARDRGQGRIPADTPSAAMLKLNYDSFVRWGRMWEVELITLDVLKRPEQRLRVALARPQDDAQGQDQPHPQARRHRGHEAHGADRREHHQRPPEP